MRIIKVKVKERGMAGLDIVFHKQEADSSGKFQFNNEYAGKFKAPVSGDLKKLLDKFKPHFQNICRFDIDPMDIVIVSVKHKPEAGTIIVASVCTEGDQWFTVNTPSVATDEDYGGLAALEKLVNNFFAECVKYVIGKTAEPKQYLLDLVERDEKQELEFTVEEIGKMSKEEAIATMEKMLEEHGAIFLEKASDSDAEEAPVATKAVKKGTMTAEKAQEMFD